MPNAAPSALLDLVQFLRDSQDTIGLVKIPNKIEDAVKRHLLPQSAMSASCAENIVAALDHQEPSLCSRLDLHAFIIVYLILSKADDCAAQQRGLALLTESLQNVMSPLQDPSRGLEKKNRLGQKALSFLIQNFGNPKRMRWTRRWMGIFALELLTGCDENKALLLEKAQDSWRSFADNILHGSCEILKLVAGLLIRELWPTGPPTDEPWFSERDSAIYASFPRYIDHSSQWVVDFESFVDVLDSEGFLSETRSGVSVAYGVSIGSDLTYGWEEQSIILVTVSTELNIVVCPSENNPARYIDILHDQIESVSLEKRPRISQSNPLVPQNFDVLVIWLIRSSDKTFYLGAGKRFAPLINIGFTSIDEAMAVMKCLLQCAPHICEKITCSESEPLNLSQPMVGKIEEQGMSYGTVAQADNQIRPAIVSSATEPVSLPTFIRHLEPDLTHAFLNWPKNVSTGILRTTDLSHLRSDTGISIEDFPVDSAVSRSQSPTKNLEDLSEGSLRNSAEWRKGAMLIETAPELQDKNDRAMKGEVSEKRGFPAKITSTERDGDHDGFYNATPKGRDTNIERAQHISTHNEEHQGFQRALEHTLVHRARNSDVDRYFEGEVGRTTVAGAAKMDVQALKNTEHVNENTAEIRKSAVVKKKYTSKKKLPATNASKISKKIAAGKNQTGRKAESLSHKKSPFQKGQKVKDEFDFPLSPQKTRPSKTIRRPFSKKIQPKEGVIGSPPKQNFLAYRSTTPNNADVLVQNVTAQINSPVILPRETPFETRKDTGLNAKVVGVGWDEGLVVDKRPNGADSNPPRKRIPRDKSKSVTKRSRNKDDEAYSSKKGLGENMRKANQEARSAPRPVPAPRSRRVAALVADQKIKNSIRSDISQEQSHGGVTHGVEEALPPNGFANDDANIDGGESPQVKPQNLSKMFGNDILNDDGAPEITTVSKSSPQDTNVEMLTSSHITELAGNQHRHAVILPQQSILQRTSVHKTNGSLDRNNGYRQAKEAQLAGFDSVTANPVSDAYNTKEEDELKNGETILYRNPTTENGSRSLSLICLESSPSESSAPSQTCLPDEAQEICSSERLVSALELPDCLSHSRTGLTPKSSIIDAGSSKSRRFVEIGRKRKATGPERSYQEAKNGMYQGAATALLTTTSSKRGNAFASNLKKALSGLQMSVQDHHAPESRIQDQSVEQDKMDLETSVVRPSTSSSMSQISIAGGFQNRNQNQKLKTAVVDPDVFTCDALQQPSKRPRQPYTTVSLCESAQALHGTGNTTPLHEKRVIRREYSESDNEDENENEKQVPSIHARRTPKRPKKTPLQPIYTPHRIRRANSGERLHVRAIYSGATPTKASRDVNRKSNLISFDSRGPRNQGVILNQKDRLASPSQPGPSQTLAADVDRSLKRKLPGGVEEPSAVQTDLAFGKRRRISTRIPTEQGVIPCWSPIAADGTHRPSSQSTRVNENGSPMPFVRSRHFVFRDHGAHASTKIDKFPRLPLDEEQGDLLAPGNRVDTEPGISVSRNRLPRATKNDWRSSSASSKRKRYLSHLESSDTNQFTAHRIQPNGGFVDVHTETEILPIRPPDPFTESRKTHQNAFMEMLRRSGNLPHKSPLNNRQGLSGQKFDQALDEDHVCSPSTESLSSDSSMCDRWWSSSESSSSDEEALHEEENWHDNLKPHQKAQFNALYDISQRLVERLIDKENAINDLLSANKRSGMRLIHEFEKARKADIQLFRKNTDEVKKKLDSIINEELTKLKKSSMERKMKRTPVAEWEKEWEDEQRNMWTKMQGFMSTKDSPRRGG